MSKKGNSVLEKLIPLGTIQRRQQKKESNKRDLFNDKSKRNENKSPF